MIEIRAAGSAAKKPVWSRGYWARYLDTDKAIAGTTVYVNKQKGISG